MELFQGQTYTGRPQSTRDRKDNFRAVCDNLKMPDARYCRSYLHCDHLIFFMLITPKPVPLPAATYVASLISLFIIGLKKSGII